MRFPDSWVGQLTIGKTGYAFVLNARKGEGYGDFLAHPTRKGKNGLTAEDGNEQVDSVRHVLEHRAGVLLYRWRDDALGDRAPREKIAAVSELPELGWLIATSGYVEEFIQFSRAGRDRMVLAVTVAAMLSMLALYVGVGRWVVSPMLRLQDELRGAGQTLRTRINAMPDMVCFKAGWRPMMSPCAFSNLARYATAAGPTPNHALYEAKRGGRNRICLYRGE